MTKIFVYVSALVIGLGTTAMVAINHSNAKPNASAEQILASDGAFRDGLFLGKLAAESGQPLRAAIGRWSRDQDRSMFAAGYLRGYNESLVSARANDPRARSNE
jgi:hypothetical protein